MPIIYHVTIEPTETENHFHITWHNPEKNTRDSFTQDATITEEETQRLWLWPQCQLGIGQKLFSFLDGESHCFQQALDHACQQGKKLQIHLSTCRSTADWPFELVAKDNTFLLSTRLHLVRYVSAWGKDKEVPPEDRPLKLLFMACSPLDVQPELDFEREEEAIFRITENLAINMDVDDSGSLESLHRRLEEEQYDVLHLSAFADINPEGTPFIIMEDELGAQHTVFPDELWQNALKENPPRLLFISGSRTGEIVDKSESMAAVLFARWLVEKYNMPAVLGWGRSVRDDQSIVAEKMLFHELSRGKTILEALLRARYELIKDFSDNHKPAWPLLRLFSNGMPLNSMVIEEQQWKPKVRIVSHVYLKNSRVKVLLDGFVGRRRPLQTSLRALKQDKDKVGLLLLGTGGLGKSCLAGKICERFPDTTLIIVHGRLNVITLEEALTDAFVAAQDEKGQRILSLKIEMKDKLPQLCSTSFKEKSYLLLLDDFEQNLEGADKGEPGPLLPETVDLLKVLLHYLPFSGKMTQMMITSRYHFSLSEQNSDMVEDRLEKIWLTSFQKSEQRKKAKELPNILTYEDQSKVPELLAAGHGNPRLMEWLDILVGQMKAVELPILLEAIRDKQEDFVHQHVIHELLDHGGKELENFLCHFSIYRRPVLLDGVEQVMKKVGLVNWQKLLDKGMGLSLVEHDQTWQSYLVTPVLREELEKNLEDVQLCHGAAFTYYKKRCEPLDPIDPLLTEEWVFHALECGEEDVASDQGFKLIVYLRECLAYQESLRIGIWILALKKRDLSTADDTFLLNAIASTLHLLGEYQQSIKYNKQALAIDQIMNNEDKIKIAIDLQNIGEGLRELGQYTKANDLCQRALKINQSILFKKHPAVAGNLNNLGEGYRDLGQYKKAINYYQQALAIDRAEYEENHPDISRDLNNLGLAFLALGDHTKANEYLQQSLLINRSLFGEEHPNVAKILVNLGAIWDNLGDFIKAINYYLTALEINRTIYGNEHPSTADILHNLGASWVNLSEYKKAEECYQEALAIKRKTFGLEHPEIANTSNHIGEVRRLLGHPQQAIELYLQALAIYQAMPGENHPTMADILINLGQAWHDLGDYNKAIEYYQKALTIDLNVYGKEHPSVAITLNNLGEVWRDSGDPQKAIKYCQQALTIWEKSFGKNHYNVAIALNNLALSWSALNEYKKAIHFYRRAIKINQKVYGEGNPHNARVLSNLGSTWSAMGKYTKAIDYCQQALAIETKIYGEEHPNIADVLNNIASAWLGLGDYDKAIDHFQKALAIDRMALGDESPKVGIGLTNLGVAYFESGRTKQAKDYFEKAYDILNKSLGPEHSETINTCECLAACQ